MNKEQLLKCSSNELKECVKLNIPDVKGFKKMKKETLVDLLILHEVDTSMLQKNDCTFKIEYGNFRLDFQ